MSRHLSWEQISSCLIDQASLDSLRHARECGECREALGRVEARLAEFRGAVRRLGSAAALADPGRHLDHLLPARPRYAAGALGPNLIALLAHVMVVAGLILAGGLPPVRHAMMQVTPLFAPPQPVQTNRAGGGAASRWPVAEADRRAKPAPRAFVPPLTEPRASTAQAPVFVDADTPDLSASNSAAANGLGVFLGGAGAGAGMGRGYGGGIGNGRSAGTGSGTGGGTGGGTVMRIGNGVSAPRAIFTPPPEYTDEARRKKFQGSVLLSIVVDETGKAIDITVLRSVGLGLDEKAMEAVKRWRFEPGRFRGKPVAVQATIEVTFRLL